MRRPAARPSSREFRYGGSIVWLDVVLAGLGATLCLLAAITLPKAYAAVGGSRDMSDYRMIALAGALLCALAGALRMRRVARRWRLVVNDAGLFPTWAKPMRWDDMIAWGADGDGISFEDKGGRRLTVPSGDFVGWGAFLAEAEARLGSARGVYVPGNRRHARER